MKKHTLYNISLLIIGIPLIVLALFEVVDEFWSGMGSALTVIGLIRMLRSYRLNKSEAYREKMETFENDERFQFIRSKAWAWAGYLFILISAVCVIVFKIMGLDTWSLAASYSVCLLLVLYWGSYFVLKKKY